MSDQPSIANPSTALPLIENLGAGVTLEWTHDRRIPIIAAERPTREAIDIWLAAMPRMRAMWRESTVATTLVYDISSKHFGPTPYLRAALDRISVEAHTHVPHFTVAILSPTLFGEVFYVMSRVTPLPKNFRVRTFMKRDIALAWVKKALDEADATLRNT